MIEQISNALMAVAFYSDSAGVGVTGLTVTVDVYRIINSAGTPTPTQVVTGGSATSIGGGLYSYILAAASVTVEASYLFIFKTASTSVAQKQLPAMWTVQVAGVEFLDSSIAGVQADTDNIQTRLPAALSGGRIDAIVGAMAANTLTASALAADAVNEIADQVWDEAIAGHLTAGSTGAALDDAGGAAASTGLILENLQVINIDGTNLERYGDMVSATLGASVLSVDVPNRATHILVQALAQNIHYTTDGSTPTTTHGFVIYAGAGPRLITLDSDEVDPDLQFLRAASGAILEYQFYDLE